MNDHCDVLEHIASTVANILGSCTPANSSPKIKEDLDWLYKRIVREIEKEERRTYRCTICGGLVSFDGREGEFIEHSGRGKR